MIPTPPLVPALVALMCLALAACAPTPPEPPPVVLPEVPPLPAHLDADILAHYGAQQDGDVALPPIDTAYLSPENVRQEVDFETSERPGTIIVDPWEKYLYYVQGDNRAMRYRVAVGDEGRAFAGQATIPYTRQWPSWRPTDNMIREFPDQYGPLRNGMAGGINNPLGARALYLHRGGRDTYYRIHGTSDVGSIGQATSAGCIRMFHQDVIELESMVHSGAKVIVLTEGESRELAANRNRAISRDNISFNALPRTDGVTDSL